MNSKPFKNAFSTVVIFAAWWVLRFHLMFKLRSFILNHISTHGSGRVFLSHGLIVLEALILFAIYSYFRRRNDVTDFSIVEKIGPSIKSGLLVGILIFVISIPVALHLGMKFHPQFSKSEFIGNIFSNAGEELIYRGILLAAGLSLSKSTWLAVLISAIAFGLEHWDMPYTFQGYAAVIGLILGYSFVKSKSLTAPYVAHMIADVLLDSLFR